MRTARKKKLEKAVSTYMAARLLRMPRGHKKPRFAFQVDMDVESVNQQECFVLDMGDKIYLYQGASSTPFDKTAAAGFADYLEKSKNGAATLSNADDYFWRLLNGSEEEVKAEAASKSSDEAGIVAGGVAFVSDDDGWARATAAQIEEQMARVS